jgi:heme/copper-type cytochrome/quinol oxidase subunit 4
MNPNASTVDEKQRNPLLEFYISALTFAGALVLMDYSASPWREILRVVIIAIAGFAVWALLRFLRVADERQRRINFRALRFAFVAGLVLSLFGGFVQGFGVLHVSWIGVLGLQLIPWSFGLIFYSWRHQ